ncbi:hypothetical protein ACOSP7_005766 [Xanthoceras sorbifolium]
MEGIRSILISCVLMILCVTFSLVHGKYYSATEPHVRMKEKVTNLYFFFHDTLSGKNPSAVLIAKPSLPNNNDTSQSSFGSLYAVDDPLTVSSGQGSVQTLVVYFDFGFTTGELNGSAITVFSRNPVIEMERELAVIGGRGRFRMARGFAQLKTYTVDLTNGDAIVEYNVTVIHY